MRRRTLGQRFARAGSRESGTWAERKLTSTSFLPWLQSRLSSATLRGDHQPPRPSPRKPALKPRKEVTPSLPPLARRILLRPHYALVRLQNVRNPIEVSRMGLMMIQTPSKSNWRPVLRRCYDDSNTIPYDMPSRIGSTLVYGMGQQCPLWVKSGH